MQNIEDKMDDLFQKAADNYPLKTNTGNFDKLLPLIGSETAATSVTSGFAKGKRKTALLLLAFLFIGLAIGTTYLITNNSIYNTNETKVPLKENSIPVENNLTSEINSNKSKPITAKAPSENLTSSSITFYQKNKLISNTNGRVFAKLLSPVAVLNENEKQLTKQFDNITLEENNATANIISQQANNQNLISKNIKEPIDNFNKKIDTTINGTKTTDKKVNDDKSRNKSNFYFGIAAGAEYNEVRNQSMTKPGLNAGLMLGLQLSTTTSIETGVQFSQKKYYSQGKYFKPKAGSMPANMVIESLRSTSTIIEIPVSLKYNFSKKKNTLYGKAGVSSYILTKESNKYQAVVNGQEQEINTTYNKNHSYFASDLRISAGYQQAVGKKLNIRIEPFVQIPLKGIGVGNMPVTTTGLQFVLIQN